MDATPFWIVAGLFDLPQWLFDLLRTFIDHSWKTYMARWTPNSSTQMQSFDHRKPFMLRLGHTSPVPCHVSVTHPIRLKLGELLGGLSASGEDTEDVEADGLGERPALANNDLVTGLDTESGRDVCGEVLVALLVTRVLGDEVEVFTADDQSTCNPSVTVAKSGVLPILDALHAN